MTDRQAIFSMLRQAVLSTIDKATQRLETLAERLEAGNLSSLQSHARLFGFATAEDLVIDMTLRMLQAHITDAVHTATGLLLEEFRRGCDQDPSEPRD